MQNFHSPTLERQSASEYVFVKHHVYPGTQSESLEEVANALVGIHSARLPTAYVACHSRMRNFSADDYRTATFDNRNLIKLRCMRRTLHTVTHELAPIVHEATLHLRTSDLYRKLAEYDFHKCIVDEITDALAAEVFDRPIRHRELLELLSTRVASAKRRFPACRSSDIGRLLLRVAWEQGHLCYLNRARHWAHEQRFYGNTRALYPCVKLNRIDCQTAVDHLVAYHVRSFGPVSLRDINWWSGVSMLAIRRAVEKLKPELASISLNGVNCELFMFADDLCRMLAFQADRTRQPWCAFLAYEDPTLKGYFESRQRYASPAVQRHLFNSIGEARSSIVINGTIAGLWHYTRRSGRVSVDWLTSVRRGERDLVATHKRLLEDFLWDAAPVAELPEHCKVPVSC